MDTFPGNRVLMVAYSPPFAITPAIVGLIADIAERVGHYALAADPAAALRLRRINRIRTIQGSLAIEGNTLSEQQITAILEGRRVIAPPREIQEVRNAILAYERYETWNPTREDDLLAAHALLMTGLVDRPGTYRGSGVGVMSGSTQEGTSTPFIVFMLGVIHDALAAQATEQVTGQATEQVQRLLMRMGDGVYSAKALMALLGLAHRPNFLYDCLQPALAGGWLEMTHPDTPKSPKQHYRLTRSGRQLAQDLGHE